MRKYLFSATAVCIALSLFPLTPAAPVQLDKPLPSVDTRPTFAPDEVIIKFHKGLDLTSLDFATVGVAKYKQLAHRANKHMKRHGVDRLYLLQVRDLETAIKRLRRHPHIEYAEPNYIVHVSVEPDDPDFSLLYGLHNIGQTGGTPDADIDAPEAWDIQTGSSSVVVAVIDTGVDYTHDDLASNMWVNVNEIPNNGIDDDNNGFVDDYAGWDFYNNDNDPFDDHGHGTHVSGTIGAVANNGIGIVGVNWDVKIMPLKFSSSSGSGTTADAVSAIGYATTMEVDIMSNSWGGGGYSQALKDAIAAANDKGILFVAAAGNNGVDSDQFPMYPAAFDNDNIVAVAATDHDDNLAWFSSYGATSVDLGAPGVSILSTVPSGSCSLCDVSGYRDLSGTSMGTPLVSGAAALIRSQFPTLTHLEVKARLLAGVDHLLSLEGKSVSEGRLNAFNSLEDDAQAPGAITDVTPADKGFSSVTLTWTATGDDGTAGTASWYDFRYSSSLIDDTNFDNATRASGLATPQASGLTEVFTVTGLEPSTTYSFAIKAVDNVGNTGALSNITNETTTQPVVMFLDDVEGGVNGWTATGLWHQETSQADSPVTSWTYNTGSADYNYNVGTNSGTLTSPQIDLTRSTSAILALNGFYETEGVGTTWDQRWVQVSIDNGPFTNVAQVSGDVMNTWHRHEIDISAYAGYVVHIRFVFDTRDGTLNSFWGWSIDDVTVFGDTLEPNNAPIADANGPYNGTEDVATTFDGSGSSDVDNDGLTYWWDFGDGSNGTGVRPSHVYTAGGNYPVTLVVNDGNVDSAPSTTSAAITEVNDAPVANAGPDQSALVGDQVTSNGSGSYDQEGPIASYVWDFSDGSTASGAVVTHTYATAGTFTVTLTVTDGDASSDQDTASVTIAPAVDIVSITKAEYSSMKSQLKVEAISSMSGDAALEVQGIGPMNYNAKREKYSLVTSYSSKPLTVTVVSSLGGTATATVAAQGTGKGKKK